MFKKSIFSGLENFGSQLEEQYKIKKNSGIIIYKFCSCNLKFNLDFTISVKKRL